MDDLNESQLTQARLEKIQQYRKLERQSFALREEDIDYDAKVHNTQIIVEALEELTTSNCPPTRARETYLDSRVLLSTSEQALQLMQAVDVDTAAYQGAKLAEHICNNPAYWQFGRPRAVRPLAYLHGTFEPAPRSPRAPPARPARRELQRAALAPRVAPARVNLVEKRDEETRMVDMVLQHVRRAGRPLSYFHCVLHPTSFSSSVHNIYYMSFLVNAGKVAVYVEPTHGIPFVRVASSSREPRHQRVANQFLVSIDQRRWQQLVQAFNITEPALTFEGAIN